MYSLLFHSSIDKSKMILHLLDSTACKVPGNIQSHFSVEPFWHHWSSGPFSPGSVLPFIWNESSVVLLTWWTQERGQTQSREVRPKNRAKRCSGRASNYDRLWGHGEAMIRTSCSLWVSDSGSRVAECPVLLPPYMEGSHVTLAYHNKQLIWILYFYITTPCPSQELKLFYTVLPMTRMLGKSFTG